MVMAIVRSREHITVRELPDSDRRSRVCMQLRHTEILLTTREALTLIRDLITVTGGVDRDKTFQTIGEALPTIDKDNEN